MQKPANASGNEMGRDWKREREQIRLPLRLRGRTGQSLSLSYVRSPSLSATYAWRFFMMTKIEKRSCGKSSRVLPPLPFWVIIVVVLGSLGVCVIIQGRRWVMKRPWVQPRTHTDITWCVWTLGVIFSRFSWTLP